MSGLTPRQVEFFREQGYLVVEDAFDPAVLRPLERELSARIDAAARAEQAAGHLSDLCAAEPFRRRIAALAAQLADPAPLLRPVQGKLRTSGMFAVYTCPQLLDIVESVIGPEILAHPQFNARPKLPNQDATVVPWHQDLGYLDADAEQTFMVNFWIPLVDATRQNGCLEVIAGSHHQALAAHETGMGPGRNFRGIRDEALPDGERVLCPVRTGGVLLLQHKTFHRSLPNTADHVRWSLDLRYCDPGLPTGREGVPGFLARSRRDPAAVCPSAEEWTRIVEASGAPTGA